MKKTAFLLAFLFIAGSVAVMGQATEPQSATSDSQLKKGGPVAVFDKTINDFGNIDQGIPKTAEFTLTNNGDEPLLISYAKASCGCTGLKYSNEPILPKKSTTISATYNAAAPGPFIKTITIQTNASDTKVVLQIKGTVIKKEEATPVQAPEKK